MLNSSAVKIQLLQHVPEHFAQVAAWHHQECERQGLVSSLAVRQQRLLLHVQYNSIPKTLIATYKNELIGCVSLVNYSYKADSSVLIPHNSAPLWLSNLYVEIQHRRQGVGELLIDAAKKYAHNVGEVNLFLSASEYTDYYQKRGWSITRKTRLGGRPVNVMSIDLSPYLANAVNA